MGEGTALVVNATLYMSSISLLIVSLNVLLATTMITRNVIHVQVYAKNVEVLAISIVLNARLHTIYSNPSQHA